MPCKLSTSSVSRSLKKQATSGCPHIRLVPNLGPVDQNFVFDIIKRELKPGVSYRIGRFSEKNFIEPKLSFKSKVVSRNHAELWTEQGKVFLRDIGSSSGTFINHIRLSTPNQESERQELRDGDVIQLGTDYQGGLESCYRAVRIRIEINRQPSVYTRTAFQNLAARLNASQAVVEECCICLYPMTPSQALFVAPCSHLFHFKCSRPVIFQSYPGFSCPLCRHYSDLEASVEVDDELQEIADGLVRHKPVLNMNASVPKL
ncbi:hypothetical protein RO3G_10590 [Rhizopus delemar RA 99-880]|uniref:SMAD/FHA domain-containing protein n=3 Tax=Rhizopus TaxID=4842 RepID=I1CBQ0_RHIO9|nr:hypothetical protein RO3G_10590 [Rhizopus delemar RA 99-880]|eukprot:EIE85880.1 hypothetical protein RO3G_10590 [Rhizopus delemar RA 99-880]